MATFMPPKVSMAAMAAQQRLSPKATPPVNPALAARQAASRDRNTQAMLADKAKANAAAKAKPKAAPARPAVAVAPAMSPPVVEQRAMPTQPVRAVAEQSPQLDLDAINKANSAKTPETMVPQTKPMGPQGMPELTKPRKDYSGAPSAAQLAADAQKQTAMAQKQAQMANEPQTKPPPEMAAPAVMAKGGMVKKMAKGGMVVAKAPTKANCGASVPPSQKFNK